jgi:hypothetical protein
MFFFFFNFEFTSLYFTLLRLIWTVGSYVSHLQDSLQQDASFKTNLVRDIAAFAASEMVGWWVIT